MTLWDPPKVNSILFEEGVLEFVKWVCNNSFCSSMWRRNTKKIILITTNTDVYVKYFIWKNIQHSLTIEKSLCKKYTQIFYLSYTLYQIFNCTYRLFLTSWSEILKGWGKTSVLRTGIKGWWRKFKNASKSRN